MSRNIIEAATRLANASPEELQTIAKHDWDMIRDVAAVLLADRAAASIGLTDPQIKHMVDRFLSWKLPENFYPDCGISFDRSKLHASSWPTGTNLLDASLTTAMVRHLIEGMPPA